MIMKLWGFLTPHMGGGGSSGGGSGAAPTNQNYTTSNIAPWAQTGVESLIHSGMQDVYPNMTQNADGTFDLGAQQGYVPFNANSTDPATQQAMAAGISQVAGFSPLQQQSFQSAQNLQTPGQFGAATGLTGMAGMGSLQAGQNFQNMATDPNAVQSYMNPYLQASLNPQLAEIQRQYDITGQQQAGQATQQGAFGGGRDAVMAAENDRNKNTAMNQAIGQGYNTAFNNAQNQMNTGAQLGLQGYNQAGQAGANLSNIGGQQLQAQQGVIGLQNQLGSQQQQNAQNQLSFGAQNFANMQNYPMQQLGQLESLYTGAPQNIQQLGYQAPPSMVSQIGGLGTAGLGAYGLYNAATKANKKGGIIKYNAGGIVSLGLKKAMRSKA